MPALRPDHFRQKTAEEALQYKVLQGAAKAESRRPAYPNVPVRLVITMYVKN